VIDVLAHRLTPTELEFLQKVISEDLKLSALRLREGEYQYSLAKAVASFQLELQFPDVKAVIKKLYGEEKTSDIQFIRKIQTILKKMEKSNIIKILPKKKPWELQRYALLSFRFQDAENNIISLATEDEIRQAQDRLQLTVSEQETTKTGLENARTRVYAFVLALVVVASYSAIVWSVMQPVISPLIFASAFGVSMAVSVLLGKILSTR
jgi:hypothetical protein